MTVVVFASFHIGVNMITKMLFITDDNNLTKRLY